MPPKLKSFLQRWLISTAAVLVASNIVSGVHYVDWHHLFAATFLLGLLNTFVKPLVMMISFPLVIFSLGLFMVVINALLLSMVSWLMRPNFTVESFGQALLAALVISLVSVALQILTGTGATTRVEVHKSPRPRPNRHDNDDGPVIDV